jgi:hypothetical protein
VEEGLHQESVAGLKVSLQDTEKVKKDMTNENNTIKTQSTQNWVSNSKNANTANYNSNILLTHKPNVILA